MECPHCTAPSIRISSTACCQNCGWNVEKVVDILRSRVQLFLAAAILLVVASSLVYLQNGADSVPAVVVVALGGLTAGILGLYSWRRRRSLSSMIGHFKRRPPAPRAKDIPQQRIPKVPRAVVLSAQGRGWLAAVVFLLGATVWGVVAAGAPGLLMFALVSALVGPFVFQGWNERRLLRLGHPVIGIVKSQRVAHSRNVSRRTQPSSRVVYEYQDASGRIHQNETGDWSGTMFEDMPLTVFYDLAKPSSSVALECCLHRLKT